MKPFWEELYHNVPSAAEKLRTVSGVLSVFNSNIDAVVKVSPALFMKWAEEFKTPAASGRAIDKIDTAEDLLNGFLYCFEKGAAQERLIQSESLFQDVHRVIGYDRLQMGGQGGIIGNVMSAAGVQSVLVHAASLPKEQASLYLKNTNLLSADKNGNLVPAHSIHREGDIPLIHWILEFDKGDSITIDGRVITCPKSNRFIATYDPLNFRLAVDESFIKAVNASDKKLNYCLLAGYQMLSEPLSDGTSAAVRIDETKSAVDGWRKKHPQMIVHFEFASTQDKNVRKMLLHSFASWADSIGVNEQELIDLLEIDGRSDLADLCRTGRADLLAGALIYLYEKYDISRIQLHFYGLFVTVQKKEYPVSPEANLRGMALAAVSAASKASTGAVDTYESLLSAVHMPVQGAAPEAFRALSDFLAKEYNCSNFSETGICQTEKFDLIAIPTILVDKPITLVGMGDTISSLSLVGAR